MEEHKGTTDVETWTNIFESERKKRNTITIQEFEKFIPMFNEELLAQFSPMEVERVTALYQQRFDMFSGITVVDTTGKVMFELPPSLMTPGTWNAFTKSEGTLANDYIGALDMKSPINASDAEIVGHMITAIEKSVDKDKVAEYFRNRLRIETSYSVFDRQEDSLKDQNTVEAQSTSEESDEPRITIDTEGMF